MTNITATAQGVRVSTRKVRLVADSVRNMKAADALSQLRLVNKHGATVLARVIRSAVANAVNNNKLSAADLVISKLTVDEAPFLKRFHVGHRGHIRTYKKRGSHITVVLSAAEVKLEKKAEDVNVEEPKKEQKKETKKAKKEETK
ncbi:MAG: 50S ribosomal protein L22 [Patescibacteria group bacterium]|nr:50S ribosomal protein L22 [Patescibacteria group bacterium]MDE2589722.1 50S ribosomal protein L22 [Patescibacteria group bacterium]